MTFDIDMETGVPVLPEGTMFYFGAQSDNDGELLPGSFTVFAPHISINTAIDVIMQAIHEELVELDIDNAMGSMAFGHVTTWQEFADIKLPDDVKMRGLSTAMIASTFAVAIDHGSHLAECAQEIWVKTN